MAAPANTRMAFSTRRRFGWEMCMMRERCCAPPVCSAPFVVTGFVSVWRTHAEKRTPLT